MAEQGTRIAWITGGGSGIGRGLTLKLADEGYTVAISGRTRETLEETADAAPAGRVHAYPVDVTDAAALARTAERIAGDLGAVELAIANAGIFKPFSVADFSAELLADYFNTNVLGVTNMIATLLPGMLERGRGHVVVMGSLAGVRGLPRFAPYGATKAALINLVEGLRFELEPRGIALSIVNPGFVATPLTRNNDSPMPCLMSVDDAVAEIWRGITHRRFEIAFPKRLSIGMRFARCLPYALYFPLIGKAMK
ncbi:MAG: SDR family NAD(P)-dependent oxidoreductase [Gammaproteobacteria bacterium]